MGLMGFIGFRRGCVLEIVAHLPPVREHQRRQEMPAPLDKPGIGFSFSFEIQP